MTLVQALSSWLNANPSSPKPAQRQFVSEKNLCEPDQILVDMLNSPGHESVCYCVCDPSLTDCPIIFSSDGFCTFTGYNFKEIEGRNCRFLQGHDTCADDVSKIRATIQSYENGTSSDPVSVNLLNYRKDGTAFCNEFFLAPLRDESKQLQYLIGVQCPVKTLGPGQAPNNAGYEDRLFLCFCLLFQGRTLYT